MSEHGDLRALVEGDDGISVLRGGGKKRDWNGIHYKTGLSSKNVNAKELSINVATIPPGGVAYAHIHVEFEVMLYILEGDVRHEYGDGCKQVVDNYRRRLHLHRAGHPARGLQFERQRAGGGIRRPLDRRRMGQDHPLRAVGFGTPAPNPSPIKREGLFETHANCCTPLPSLWGKG